jgi:hypothetical protein
VPRSRNIKPGFFANEQLAECEPLARLCFIGLWTIADKEGYLEERPRKIKAHIFPYDSVTPDDIERFLHQLEQNNLIMRYAVNSQKYIWVINFSKHQHPHYKEVRSDIPAPDLSRASLGQASGISGASIGQVHDKSDISPAESFLLKPESLVLNPEPALPAPAHRKAVADGEPPTFQEFYDLYPKTNCSRKEALKSYMRALTGADHETIIAGVKEYTHFIGATGTPVAHATTWLNNDRWTVDYDAAIAARQLASGKPGGRPQSPHDVREGAWRDALTEHTGQPQD